MNNVKSIFQDFQQALASLAEGPILLHCDLFRIGLWQGITDRHSALSLGEKCLFTALDGRTALLPTFNYDFCRTGLYDVRKSPSQVGALTEYIRTRYWQQRTRTPVFSFCQLNTPTFSMGPSSNCFGESSTFAELVKQNGSIGFFGAAFASNTFIHHVEELAAVPYRFHKQFRGKVVCEEQVEEVTLTYRVRPLELPGAVIYDWQRMEEDLRQEGIIQSIQVGLGKLHLLYAPALREYWLNRLFQDTRYFLTQN